MQRPLLLSACSAVLLLLVSTATGQTQEEKVFSAAGNTPDKKGEKSTENDEEDQKKHEETGQSKAVLLMNPNPTIQREATSRLITMIPQPTPTPEAEAFPHIPEDPQDTVLRVHDLMSRLSSLVPAQTLLSSTGDATPSVAEENADALRPVSPKPEPAALGPPAAVSDRAPAADHSGTFPSSGTAKRTRTMQGVADVTEGTEDTFPFPQAPAAARDAAQQKIFEPESPQRIVLRGAAAGGRMRPLEVAPVDWSTVPPLSEMEFAALEPMFGVEDFGDAAALATYTGLMKALEAFAAVKRWSDQMWTYILASAGTTFKGFEGRAEEKSLNEPVPIEEWRRFKERMGFLPFARINS